MNRVIKCTGITKVMSLMSIIRYTLDTNVQNYTAP